MAMLGSTSWRKWLRRRPESPAALRPSAAAIERLEERRLLATFTVSTTADGGPGSFRQAILDANAFPNGPSPDLIEFRIGSGPATIAPATPLPAVTDPLFIDGATQPGYLNAPIIELSGAGITSFATGLSISAGGSTVRGLVINRFTGPGIALEGAGNTIQGNYIGTNAAGSAASANALGITVASSGNRIGGVSAGEGNLVSGNTAVGIEITSGDANLIQGNIVGLDAAGLLALPNAVGVEANGVGTVVGGSTAGARNLIGGNPVGIYVVASPGTSSGIQIQGNWIGLGASGAAVANGVGIQVFGGGGVTVGGTLAGEGNVISGNQAGMLLQGEGSNIVRGNRIGTDPAGTASVPNAGSGLILQSPNNLIGGNSSAARNIISGNAGDGVTVLSGPNTIQGNFIGVDVQGAALGNHSSGVNLLNTSQIRVGGPNPGEGNIISANQAGGISLISSQSTGLNIIEGNGIGVGVDGVAAMGNGAAGIQIINGLANEVRSNTVAHNQGAGIAIQAVEGSAAGNILTRNSIFANQGLGIDLGLDGPTLNDPADADAGANGLLNFPVLTSAQWLGQGHVSIAGEYHGVPNTTFAIELFYSSQADPTGYGEGQTFLRTLTITTDATGAATFSWDLTDSAVQPGDRLSVTATASDGSTSEFSPVAPIGSGPAITAAGNDAITGQIEVPLQNVVLATFTDADTSSTATSFTATIDWGDDSFDTGIVRLGANGFEVVGSHLYFDPGPYTIAVHIAHADGRSVDVTAHAAIADSLLVLPVAITGAAGQLLDGVLVAAFHDAFAGGDAIIDYSADVDWGDGTITAGAIVAGAAGYEVHATHAYATSGSYVVHVTVGTSDGRSASANSAATITGGLTITPRAITGTATVSAQQILGFLADSKPGSSIGDFDVTVNWGDGSAPAPVTLKALPEGVYELDASHAYAAAGVYTVTITATHADTRTVTQTATATIAAPGLIVLALNPRVTAGVPFTAVPLARITDERPGTVPSDYAATIDWGDESDTTPGTVTLDGQGRLVVLGSHAYAQAGNYSVHISVAYSDERIGGAFGLINASAPQLSARGINIATVEGLPTPPFRVGSFTDPLYTPSTNYRARVSWGDGRSSIAAIARDKTGSFTLRGAHRYREAGQYAGSLSIRTSDGRTVTAAAIAHVVNAVRIAMPVAIAPVRGRFAARLLSFTDANPFAQARDYTASIAWGDGIESPAAVRKGGALFNVVASHRYRRSGSYSVLIRVTDSTGESFTARQTVVVS